MTPEEIQQEQHNQYQWAWAIMSKLRQTGITSKDIMTIAWEYLKLAYEAQQWLDQYQKLQEERRNHQLQERIKEEQERTK